MSENLVLYDLATKEQFNRCWSYNVWKTRLALNYKKIPYTTAWVNHETLGPTIKALGVPSNTPTFKSLSAPAKTSSQGFEYTVPTVKFPDGSVVTDSAAIAERLEALYPDPPMFLDANLQGEAGRAIHLTIMPLFAVYMPCIARNVIPESTVPYFAASREKIFGMSLEELEKTKGGEQAWIAARPGFAAMKALTVDHKQDDGPFIRGSQVCYADFVLLAGLEALKRAGDDMFEKAVAAEPELKEYYAAAGDWFTNDQ